MATHSKDVFLVRLRERFDELARARGYLRARVEESSLDPWSFELDADLPDGRMRYRINADRRTVKAFLAAAEPEGRVAELGVLLAPFSEITKRAAEALAEHLARDLPAAVEAPPPK